MAAKRAAGRPRDLEDLKMLLRLSKTKTPRARFGKVGAGDRVCGDRDGCHDLSENLLVICGNGRGSVPAAMSGIEQYQNRHSKTYALAVGRAAEHAPLRLGTLAFVSFR